MIVDIEPPPDHNNNMSPKTPTDNPPSYSSSDYTPVVQPGPSPIKQLVEPSAATHLIPALPSTTVYHYVHPHTNEHLASLLPPDHPEMICLQQGGHLAQTKFGVLGLLAAVLWFPLGIGLCLLDRRVKCRRCGYIIDDGICG